MTPAFLLGLLPPPVLASRVETFRARLGVRESVPHVTVKARSGLDADLAWLPVAREVVAASPPVTLRVGAARAFGGERAVYLAVHSPEAVALHLRLLEALRPPTRLGDEGAHMTPHLTLALNRRGVKLREVLAAAQAEFSDLEARPLTFTAREVWLLRKPGPGSCYVPEEAWPLGQE
ncbi:2'-5' RNA ligase family protein [Deinococcus sp. YIM 77859]|uniref:2'-5' RNA ligase family protein n=1 Tax=Deinococcus sp. YIM 77859 TaxID=1540221 RepID=UPI0005548BB2|nr:2'-5' RNA ligase family protein [Deinococcus sp. YIM 77859]